MSPAQLYVIDTGLMAIPLLQYKGLNARKQVAIFTHLEIYMVSLKPTFLHDNFSPKFLSFTDDHRATPVQDTTQQRYRRRRAAGTRPKDSF